MHLPRRARFSDIISRQLAMFEEENSMLLRRVSEAKRDYEHSGRDSAEERYGDYMDLVEEAEDELLALRDRYAETMAARDRTTYEREFTRAAERKLPTLTARRDYLRRIDPEFDA